MKFLVIIMCVLSISFSLQDSSARKGESVIAELAEPSDVNWVAYQMGIASWYGPGFHGRRTASGEIYNMHDMTAAHKTLKFGTVVKVIDLETLNYVIVTINDRGPFIRGRVIDLSKEAMKQLANDKGLVKVKLEIIK